MKFKRASAKAFSLFSFCCIFACIPCEAAKFPIFSYGDNDELKVDHPLSVEERSKLPRAVKILHVLAGADDDLLNNRKLFPNLSIVTLAGQTNDNFLKALASNYPSISVLSIRQIAPLSAQATSCLQNFRKLKALELHCQLANPGELSEYIPRNLEILWISQTCNLPKLPNLNHLTLANCSVKANFFEHLEAPKLEMLNLSKADIEEGALNTLSNFPHLKNLELPKAYDKQRDKVSKLTQAHVRIEGDPIGPPTPLVAPLRPSPQQN
jgi:hypothetical protein